MKCCNLDRRFLRRVFPGLRLVGAIRMAFDLRKLVIAALGLALLQLGWSILDRLFPASAAVTPDISTDGLPIDLDFRAETWTSRGTPASSRAACRSRSGICLRRSLALFDPRSRLAGHAACDPGHVLAASSSGESAGARFAGSRSFGLPACSRPAWVQAIGFFACATRLRSMLAPFIPFGGLAFCGVMLAGFGLLYWLPVVGSVLGGVLFVIPLVIGLIMTLLAVALAAGWPLLQAAIAAGAEDALDALSRSFGYVNQRIGSLMALAALRVAGGDDRNRPDESPGRRRASARRNGASA